MSATTPDSRALEPGLAPLLTVRGATKRFGAVLALDAVDLDVRAGRGAGAPRRQRRRQVHADQVHQRRAAARRWRDRAGWRARASIHSPADARALGIETVYQDLALFDNLSPDATTSTPAVSSAVRRWLPRSLRFLRPRPMTERHARRARAPAGGASLTSTAPSGCMSGGQRQAVAVSRAAAFASNVVILDEPTAALGVRESRNVLDLIRVCAGESRRDRDLARAGSRASRSPTAPSCCGAAARWERWCRSREPPADRLADRGRWSSTGARRRSGRVRRCRSEAGRRPAREGGTRERRSWSARRWSRSPPPSPPAGRRR